MTVPSTSLGRTGSPARRIIELVAIAATVPGAARLLPGNILPEHYLFVLLLAVLLMTAASRFHLSERLRFPTLVLGIWVSIGLVSTILNSPDVVSSLRIVAWQASALCLGVVSATYLRSEAARQRVLQVFLISTALVTVAGLLAYLAGFSYNGLLSEVEVFSSSRRLSGVAPEPNLFGSQCMAAFLLSITYPLRFRFLGSIQLILLIGIGASFTRAVWIASLLALLYISLPLGRGASVTAAIPASLRPRRRTALRTLVAFAVAVGIATIAVPAARDEASQRLKSLVELDDGTGAYRQETWRTAMGDLAESNAWALGLGVNTFGQRHENPYDASKPAYLGNSVVVQLYETGVVGLTAFLAGLIGLAWRARLRRPATALVLAALVAGVGTSALWFGFLWIPYWFLATYPGAHIDSGVSASRSRIGPSLATARRPAPSKIASTADSGAS